MAAVITAEGGGQEVLMHQKHIVEKIVFYNKSQSDEPLIHNGAFYLRQVVRGTCDIIHRRKSNKADFVEKKR